MKRQIVITEDGRDVLIKAIGIIRIALNDALPRVRNHTDDMDTLNIKQSIEAALMKVKDIEDIIL